MSQFILFLKNTLHVSDGLSVHHQEIMTVHTAKRICQPELLTACLQAVSSSGCLLLYVQQ